MRFVLSVVLWGALAAAAGIAAVYLLPLAAPFLIAFAAAAAMEPAVETFCRRGMSRSLAAGLLTALVLLVLGGGTVLAVSGAFRELSDLAGRTPELLEMIDGVLGDLKQRLLSLARTVPDGLSGTLSAALDGVAGELSAIPARLSEKLLELVTDWAKQSPDALLFAATTAIGIYFFSAYYPDITGFVRRQLPAPWREKTRRAWRAMKSASGGYLRVQGLLSVITFGELLLAFLLLRIPHAAAAAAVTAVIDALPVLGSGTVLLPWAGWCLLSGEAARGLGLLAAYGIITSVRSAIQARLMDRHMGLHPVVSLITVYVGWKLCGLSGMILFPLAAVVIRQLNDAGVIHLYRSSL